MTTLAELPSVVHRWDDRMASLGGQCARGTACSAAEFSSQRGLHLGETQVAPRVSRTRVATMMMAFRVDLDLFQEFCQVE